MEWLRVVIEWINSLNVLEAPIKTISAFQDKKLYEKLIKLSWKKDPNTSDGKDILTTFIEDEYPKFRINKGKDQGYSEDIYIVTLLLSHVSLNTVFHQPMCTKLPHEIQVIIKSFLEIVLPYGRSITIEVLKDAIMDLTSSEKDNAFKTPRSHSLKGFFTSPVARSAQSHRMLNEKNRELQHLRSELETERFEKADLQEDLKIEQNKVQGLLKQLEEKSTEIKTLKAEKIKFATPQSCKKKKNTLYNEDYYKKEINKLENQLTQCHDELIKLEDQKTNITKKLKFAEKRNTSLHEKCNNLERSIETLTSEIEAKERELINLKISNEDLRTHIQQLNGVSMRDESFETEDMISANSFLSSLNTSETLSSVIDIQLQEARSENTLLKAQIIQLKDKLETTSKENDNATQLIFILQNKVKLLDDIQKEELRNAEKKILSLEETHKALQNERSLLQDQCKNLESLSVHNSELIVQAEQSKKELNLQLNSLNEQIEHLNKTLDAETVKSSNLEKVIHHQKKITDDHAKIENENMVLKQKVHDLEILEQKYKKEWDLELNSLNEQIEHLNKTLNAETVKSSNLEQVIHDQKKIIDDHAKAENENKVLKQKIHNLEILEQKRKNYIQNVIKEKTNLQELLSKVIISLGNLNDSFISLKQKWNQALNNFTNLYISNNLKCQDVEQLQIKKITIKKMLDKYDINHIQITKSIVDILWKRFYCAEQQLVNTYIKCSYDENESSFAEFYIEDNHIKEKEIIEEELENITMICNNVITSEAEIETFMHLISSHEKNCLTEQIKKEDNEQKLQLQIDQLTKEKKEIKNKLDLMRVRNAKLERTLEELRAEKKKIQEETKLTSQLTDLDDLKKEVAQLKKGNLLLQEEIDKLNKESTEDVKKEISEAQLKEIHSKYELKLENMKQQMKVAYNEQVSKLNKEQEKAIQEKVEQFQLRLEQLCQKHKEEIAKYKTHVNELNSQFWNVGERLLTAQQEKQEALLKLNELKVKLQNEAEQNPRRLSMHHKTIKTEKPENPFENSVQENSQIFSKELQEENTYEKQHCARNMHAMVNAFNAEDEEGEVFDNIYLADMKDGHCFPTVDLDRLSTLRMRNSLCKPHLKSSYPAETQFQPLYFSEEEIKAGEIKSPNSRILKERNADRRATATPRRSKGIFTLRRQDENVAGTPRTRRLSNIFRKTRTTFS